MFCRMCEALPLGGCRGIFVIRVIVYCLSELKDGFGREISTLLLALAPSAKARGVHPSAPPPPQ